MSMRADRYKATERLAAAVVSMVMVLLTGAAARCDDAVGTIVFIRHGEKPQAGLGQLDCQGLNRALALPRVIAQSFGKPDAIFAPNPAGAKEDDGVSYDYVRPLATIEPTAIAFGLPVEASIGYSDGAGLQAALEKALAPQRAAFVLVAWEHKVIVTVVKALLAAHGGDPAVVPKWGGDDFDSMYVVTLSPDGTKATFALKHEGLDGLPDTCPH